MPAKIGTDQVRQVARLARINLSQDEIRQFADQISDILAYVEQLNELNTDGVQPTTHPLRVSNVFRLDQVGQSLTNNQALANAPQRQGDFFAVPRVLE